MSLPGRPIRVGETELNVVLAGTGPAVLLLHGFPDSAALWRKQIPALVAAGFQTIVPDLHGFGESDSPLSVQQYRLARVEADMLSLLDQLGIAQARLVGHDLGAVVGWQLAIHHPERFDRYAALSVGHPAAYRRGGLGQKAKSWYVVVFQVPGLAERLLPSFGWRLFRRLTGNHPEADQWIADLARPGRLTAGLNWYRANTVRLVLGQFPPVTIPVLGIWSDRDFALTEAQMVQSARYVSSPWRYERIEGAGHWIPLDAAERLNGLLLDFLR